MAILAPAYDPLLSVMLLWNNNFSCPETDGSAMISRRSGVPLSSKLPEALVSTVKSVAMRSWIIDTIVLCVLLPLGSVTHQENTEAMVHLSWSHPGQVRSGGFHLAVTAACCLAHHRFQPGATVYMQRSSGASRTEASPIQVSKMSPLHGATESAFLVCATLALWLCANGQGQWRQWAMETAL
jgi:hypothetical protein